MNSEQLQTAVLALHSDLKPREKADRPAVLIPVQVMLEVMSKLCTETEFAFDILLDHVAIDWLVEKRIELIYQLYSTVHQHSLQVSVHVGREEKTCVSVCNIWSIAEWQEREVYDLFGVLYAGHPDLRRVFLEDDWVGFPLLKDYKDSFMLERPW